MRTSLAVALRFRRRRGRLHRLNRIDLRQHLRQLALQIELGLLVIRVRKLANSKFKLKIAQVFVNLRLAFFQVGRRRDWWCFGHILRPDEQGKEHCADRDEHSYRQNHSSSFSTSLSIWS